MSTAQVKAWARFRANKGAVLGLLFLLVGSGLSTLGPRIVGGDPWAIVGRPFLPPSWEQPLGTDTLGRSVLAGLLYGGRVSMLIGLAAATISVVIGVVVGAVAAFYGGWVDDVLMRLTEFFQIVPAFVLVLVLIALFEPSLGSVITGIGVVSWPAMARLARAEFLSLRHREFVLAERAIGAGDLKIMVRTILPNAMPVIAVYSSLLVATALLFESSLSFLGLTDPNYISWGFMVGASRSALQRAWWLAAFPGIAILVTVVSINLVGDGLNDALNAKGWVVAAPHTDAIDARPETTVPAITGASEGHLSRTEAR